MIYYLHVIYKGVLNMKFLRAFRNNSRFLISAVLGLGILLKLVMYQVEIQRPWSFLIAVVTIICMALFALDYPATIGRGKEQISKGAAFSESVNLYTLVNVVLVIAYLNTIYNAYMGWSFLHESARMASWIDGMVVILLVCTMLYAHLIRPIFKGKKAS